MGSHYHRLAKGSAEDLADSLHRAHSKLANVRNFYEDRRGSVFGRRYKVITIADELHAHRVIRYVPMNPVHHKLSKDPARWGSGVPTRS